MLFKSLGQGRLNNLKRAAEMDIFKKLKIFQAGDLREVNGFLNTGKYYNLRLPSNC